MRLLWVASQGSNGSPFALPPSWGPSHLPPTHPAVTTHPNARRGWNLFKWPWPSWMRAGTRGPSPCHAFPSPGNCGMRTWQQWRSSGMGQSEGEVVAAAPPSLSILGVSSVLQVEAALANGGGWVSGIGRCPPHTVPKPQPAWSVAAAVGGGGKRTKGMGSGKNRRQKRGIKMLRPALAGRNRVMS